MIDATQLVFDDTVEDTTVTAPTHLVTTYTSLEHSDFLASASQLVLQVSAEVLSIQNDVPLSVAIEHSADGQNWQSKNTSPVVSGTVPGWGSNPNPGVTVTFQGGESWPARPNQRFARLCVSAGGSVGPFSMNISIVCGRRTRVTKARSLPKHSSLPGDATLFGVRREVVTEIENVLRAAGDIPLEDQYAFLQRRLSPETQLEVERFRQRLQSLHPSDKRALVRVAAATIGIVLAPVPKPMIRRTAPASLLCDECLPRMSMPSVGGDCGGACHSSRDQPTNGGS